jgi:hypothetical protein
MKKQFIFLSLILLSFSCGTANGTEQKFDKTRWAEVADLMTFPNRKYMIEDFAKNYHLKGKKYGEIIELLGQPQSELDSNLNVFYNVDIDYGADIDPVYSKTLMLQFDRDTVVNEFKVDVWKK